MSNQRPNPQRKGDAGVREKVNGEVPQIAMVGYSRSLALLTADSFLLLVM